MIQAGLLMTLIPVFTYGLALLVRQGVWLSVSLFALIFAFKSKELTGPPS